jgi:uncharacterized membrane protein YoaK (UPF0700 family)
MSSERERVLVPVLLGFTFVTGLVDAVSVLALGRVFTANMTGNVVFLGFAAAGVPGLSLAHSSLALLAFLVGSVVGGRIASPSGDVPSPRAGLAFGCEAALLFAAAGVAVGAGTDLSNRPGRLQAAIVLTGLAMGIRNAFVRKLALPDLTTTVLTLTITGLGADSRLAGGQGPRWQRRIAVVVLMFAGALVGAWLVNRSVAVTLGIAGAISGAGAVLASRGERQKT